jgi:hypothetical protein
MAEFQWRLHTATGRATVGVTRETVRPGFRFVLATCETHHVDGSTTRSRSTTQIPGGTLGVREFRTCKVYNVGPGAHLTVVKRLIPSSDPGRFDLLVGGIPRIERVGNGGSTGRLLLGFGTHTVSERVTAEQENVITLDQYSIRTRCVNRTTGDRVASGTGGTPVSVRLENATDDIVCTITNRRIAEPPPDIPPPGPPIVPPPPCPDCLNVAASQPQLVISKRMPVRTMVGRRVPITITVRNVGTETAHRVLLNETPPGGGRIVSVAGLRATRLADGTLEWSLGNLAPGARRTVRATMLVTRAGPLRNTTVVDGTDAEVAVDVAGARAAAAPAPPFTG